MKKKIFAGTLSVLMMGAMAVPAYAEEPQTGTTTINTTVSSTFVLSIPAETKDIKFGAISTELGNLKVTGNVLPTQSVAVKATKTELKIDENTVIPFELKNGIDEFISAEWNEQELRVDKSIPLTVDVSTEEWGKAKAGSYIGNIVFEAELR